MPVIIGYDGSLQVQLINLLASYLAGYTPIIYASQFDFY